MKDKKSQKKELVDIIRNKRIYPVFQPIVDIKSGSIVAYEALSRISGDSTMIIGELFELACRCGMVWELEAGCTVRPRVTISSPQLSGHHLLWKSGCYGHRTAFRIFCPARPGIPDEDPVPEYP